MNTENEEKKGTNKKVLIIEIIVAIIVLAFAVSLIIIGSKKKSASENAATSNNTAASTSTDILFDPIPEIGSSDSYNTCTEEECKNDSSLVKVDFEDGSYAYVINFDNINSFKNDIIPTKEMVDDAIDNNLLQYYAEDKEPDHEDARLSDTVSINYVGMIDGVAFDNGSADNQLLLLGSHSFIDDFEDQLVGMKKGDTRTITVTFPEDYYSEDLAGKDADFTVTLNEIVSTSVTPEFNDEFVKGLESTDYSTVQECYDYFEKTLTENSIYNLITNKFYISSINTEEATKQYESSIQQYIDSAAAYYGTDIVTMVTSNGGTIDEFKASVMEQATELAKFSKLYSAISKKYNITIEESDVENFAQKMGIGTAEDFRKLYDEETINTIVLEDKIMTYFYENIK